MKNNDNSKFAHRTKESDIENFYKIMYGAKKIKTKKDQEDFDAWYFAMCLLLPKDPFLQMIDFLGGMNSVIKDYNKKQCIARCFNVESRLVTLRIKDILSQEKQQQEASNSKKLTNRKV